MNRKLTTWVRVGVVLAIVSLLSGCGPVHTAPGLGLDVSVPEMVIWNGNVYAAVGLNGKHGKRLGTLADSPVNAFDNWAVYGVQGNSSTQAIDVLTTQHQYYEMKFVTSQNITFNGKKYRITALGVGPPLVKQIGIADGLKVFEISGYQAFQKIGVQEGKGTTMLAVGKH